MRDPYFFELGEISSELLDDKEKYFEYDVLKYIKVATMKEGESFGELALIEKKPRFSIRK